MKRTLLTLALVTAAGTASAQVGAGVGTNTGVSSGGAATMTAPPAAAGTTVNTGATMNTNAGMRGAQGGGAQMNTGAQTSTNTQMNSNVGASGAAGASGSTNMANAPSPRLTGAAGVARKRIEQDGYKNVQNLQQGADGLWHGTAMRGNAQVQVTVDRTGNVSAQ